MILNGYLVDTHPNLNSTAILIDYENTTTGTATAVFTGASGTYDIVISTIPENDGTPTVRLFIAGVKILEEILPTDPAYYTLGVRKEYTVTSVSIQKGDEIKIEGVLDVGANARVDKITFKPKMVLSLPLNKNNTIKTSKVHVNSNPFARKVKFSVPYSSVTAIEIYDSAGQVVYTHHVISALHLRSAQALPGSDMVEWNGTDNSGIQVQSGIYYYKINGRGFEESGKIMKLDKNW